ncbi:MAG: sigma-54 dependent transcriptional regulator [candidate division Zixibacteria bacterium]|nr:sigma-54 dependent transcriptional regulator [candidate division Zixibacteria bacterium]MDH3936112.1 sigma-54 dependent transcriptional regulator [candidate division Zixibacteria bacterium]MDH4032643.1 sigma-54 dependent transcriptional regulator [candidate division Zixibacteria bacterium]
MTQTATSHDRILIIDQTTTVDSQLKAALSMEDYHVDTADCGPAALERLEHECDLLIVPDPIDGRPAGEFTRQVQCRFPNTAIIVVTTESSEKAGAEALTAGAHDYLVTSSSQVRILASIRRTLQLMRMKNELTMLRQTVAMSHGFDNLIGSSDSMIKLKETARKLAPTDITVLIGGPSGSGKELLARVMHHHSRRRSGPFVAVDFTAQTSQTATEQLFGDRRAQTEGQAKSAALLEQADGGTLFLDNVESVPPDLQPKLARFLTEFTVATDAAQSGRKLDLRVLAATSQDLAGMAEDGLFDHELWNLICEINLSIPSLSQRPDDIELLCEYFLRRLPTQTDRAVRGIGREAIEKLQAHDWPGNVRELETCLSRAAALSRTDLLQPEDITFATRIGQSPGRREIRILNTRRRSGLLDDTQRSIIARALDDNNWNFTQTAQELGIGRTTLWRKVKKYQLTREQTETVA